MHALIWICYSIKRVLLDTLNICLCLICKGSVWCEFEFGHGNWFWVWTHRVVRDKSKGNVAVLIYSTINSFAGIIWSETLLDCLRWRRNGLKLDGSSFQLLPQVHCKRFGLIPFPEKSFTLKIHKYNWMCLPRAAQRRKNWFCTGVLTFLSFKMNKFSG